jgi:hypothetical protein
VARSSAGERGRRRELRQYSGLNRPSTLENVVFSRSSQKKVSPRPQTAIFMPPNAPASSWRFPEFPGPDPGFRHDRAYQAYLAVLPGHGLLS